MRSGLAALCVALACSVAGAAAFAQDYPSRPIRFILPFAPGGGTDVVARLLARKMYESLGQQVVIDNRPSAGGIIGMQMAVQAAPDGYTMVMGLPVTITVSPALYGNLPYDPLRDLAPVGLAGTSAYVLSVVPALPVGSVADFIAYLRQHPDRVRYAAGTPGAGNHLAAELFKSMTGTRMTHVPYKGGGPALIGVFTGEAQVIFGSALTTVPHVRSGKLRALGVTSTTRASALPDIPTIAEAGVPGYEVDVWFGVFVPVKTPRAIVAKLNGEIARAMTDPAAKATLAAQGAEARATTPEGLAKMLRVEAAKWARVVRESGAKVQ
ncbi:MAG: tripartite tricarboxylate transporter substrate binding protein [Burkholderiales bacterium]|nr:tripartite tricarboxylate transporter substrate binding protein [Burkholderiales bacterium]